MFFIFADVGGGLLHFDDITLSANLKVCALCLILLALPTHCNVKCLTKCELIFNEFSSMEYAVHNT